MLLILSPDVLLVVWQASLTMLSNSLMHWWLRFFGKEDLLSNSIVVRLAGYHSLLPYFLTDTQKVMITAMQGSVNSSADTPHSFAGNALWGAQVPWVPTLLTLFALSASSSMYPSRMLHGCWSALDERSWLYDYASESCPIA